MNTASPLRYPGGKASLSDLLRGIRTVNGLGRLNMAEPFCGGAGASLSLLYREDTREIHINDADPSVFAFWWATLYRTKTMTDLVRHTPVNIKHWRIQRDIYRSQQQDRVTTGFATFYLNRCNRSGIVMNGGPIGGVAQKGRWRLDARYNKAALVSRLEKVAAYRGRIHLSGVDGLDFIDKVCKSDDVFLFLDPPYYEKGPTLYLNTLDRLYHAQLAARLRSMQETPWVLTYDDCSAIRDLYRGWAQIRPFRLRYAASERRSGREVLIAPKWLRLPREQRSEAIVW